MSPETYGTLLPSWKILQYKKSNYWKGCNFATCDCPSSRKHTRKLEIENSTVSKTMVEILGEE